MSTNTEIEALKNSIVTSMFVDPGDENYVMARIAYHGGLYQDFFWNAAQATEKYLKASLLLNGETLIKNNGHNNTNAPTNHTIACQNTHGHNPISTESSKLSTLKFFK